MSVIMNDEEAQAKEEVVEKPKRKVFAIWEVDGKEYRMKLSTAAICKLEEKFKTNLLNLVNDGDGMPPLSNMLYIAHAAMKEWNHGINLDDVKALYDTYLEDGGSLVLFYTEVFMQIYRVSGFFTQKMGKTMDKNMEDIEEVI